MSEQETDDVTNNNTNTAQDRALPELAPARRQRADAAQPTTGTAGRAAMAAGTLGGSVAMSDVYEVVQCKCCGAEGEVFIDYEGYESLQAGWMRAAGGGLLCPECRLVGAAIVVPPLDPTP